MTNEENRGTSATPEEIGTYEDNRPTSVLPGSNGTVSGTAISDWLDDDGKPIYDENSKEENPKE